MCWRERQIATGSRSPVTVASRAVKAVVAVLALAGTAAAHDFWVEPGAHRAAVGKPLVLRLLIGHGSDRTEYARNPKHLRSFRVVHPKGTAEVPGISKGPGGVFRPRGAGLHMFAYASRDSLAQLSREAFEAYLKEEGLTAALQSFRKRPITGRPVRELFARCAKAFVAVGGSSAGRHDQALGHELELVPQTDPMTHEAGTALGLTLLRSGKPVSGVRVSAYRREAPERVVHATTDAKGGVRLRLDAPGGWLVKSVVIERAPRRSGADWRSVWATLTFDVHAPRRAPTSGG